MIRMQKTTDCLWICHNLSSFCHYLKLFVYVFNTLNPVLFSLNEKKRPLRNFCIVCWPPWGASNLYWSSEIVWDRFERITKKGVLKYVQCRFRDVFFVSSDVAVSWQISLCKLTSWHLKEKWQGHRRDESWVHLCWIKVSLCGDRRSV